MFGVITIIVITIVIEVLTNFFINFIYYIIKNSLYYFYFSCKLFEIT